MFMQQAKACAHLSVTSPHVMGQCQRCGWSTRSRVQLATDRLEYGRYDSFAWSAVRAPSKVDDEMRKLWLAGSLVPKTHYLLGDLVASPQALQVSTVR